MDNLNQKLLYKMPIPLSPLSEQQAIVDQVDKLRSIVDEIELHVK